MRKYIHKTTGCIAIKTEGSLNYIATGPTLNFNVPSSIIESGNDWEEVKETKPSGYYLSQGNTTATRYSDAKTFSIRDVVRGRISTTRWYDGPILSFERVDTLRGCKVLAQIGIYKLDIETLEKLILTTADGVNVFDRNTVLYSVALPTFIISSDIAKHYNMELSREIFSTKEARLDYIARNKSMFSLSDIHESAHLSALEASNLIIKAKEKLKANDGNL